MRTACTQNKALQDAGLPPIRVAVSISARFRQPRLVETMRNALHSTGLEARYLELEVTESMVMHDVDVVLELCRNSLRWKCSCRWMISEPAIRVLAT